MSLLLPLLAIAAVIGALGVTATLRWLSRRDHRCSVRTRAGRCQRCAAVVRGEDRGGHMVCACGASSPHLTGAGLLHWGAEHHGERLPALPGAPGEPAAGAADAFSVLLDEMSDAERQAIVRARRDPDPITPQVIREARASAAEDAETAESAAPAEGERS